MKKILVPTDFSKPALIAIDVAADIAKRANAELILLHIVEEASAGSFNIEGQVSSRSDDWEDKIFTMRLIEKGKKQMAKAVEDLKASGVKVRPELKIGAPFHGMRKIITDQKVDLVVMGTAGQTKLEESIIGSNTEK